VYALLQLFTLDTADLLNNVELDAPSTWAFHTDLMAIDLTGNHRLSSRRNNDTFVWPSVRSSEFQTHLFEQDVHPGFYFAEKTILEGPWVLTVL